MNRKKMLLWGTAVLAVVYLGGVFYYKDHFYYNTNVYGVNISNMKLDGAKSAVQSKLSSYILSISAREQETALIKARDIELRYDIGTFFEELKSSQFMWNWPSGVFVQSYQEGNFPIVFDESKLKSILDGFAFLQEEKMRLPQNAYISEYSVDKGYEIVAEDRGTKFEPDIVVSEIKSHLYTLKPNLDVESLGVYQIPRILSDNENLIKAVGRMNALATTKIHYVGDTAVDGSIISGWIRFDGNSVIVEDDRIREFVIALAEKYDTLGKPRKFMTSAVGEVELPASKKFGWKIDQDAELNRIKADLETGQTVEREPIFSSRGISLTGNEFGNTYVEVDLTNQHMYYYKDGQMIIDSPIVTGNVARGHRTPPGIFTLRAKMRNAVLRGRDYAAPVGYWMPFNGGIGLHDANWRGSFGRDIYRYSGSHGCVNMPRGNAKALFENIEAGCPVICYNTEVRAITSVAEFQAKQAGVNAEVKGNEDTQEAKANEQVTITPEVGANVQREVAQGVQANVQESLALKTSEQKTVTQETEVAIQETNIQQVDTTESTDSQEVKEGMGTMDKGVDTIETEVILSDNPF